MNTEKNVKRASVWRRYTWPTLTLVFLLLGLLIGNALSNKANAQRFFIQNGQFFAQPPSKIEQVLDVMQRGYVDALDMDSITDEVVVELVQKLDPHSSYIPKKDLEMVNSELSSSFSGIGVQFNIQNDTVHIVSVIRGGPSESIGVLAGDKLVEVDDSVFVGKKINNERVMHTLRGPKGTQVTIGVKRFGSDEILRYTITRGDIPVVSVDASFIIDCAKDKIGFIRVNKFGESTYSEFIQALARLRSQGATRYIIDLRENSGGYMDQAIRMANEFLERGDMIVYAEGRAYRRMDYQADGSGRFKDVPLVVLIDNFSASASEIFAGAMQDNDRGTVIGRRSFGKGLVQQQIAFPDSSALRLTVARYYTPAGRCIQKPYKMGGDDEYALDLINRFENGEFFSADSIHLIDSTRYYTKKGRVVYGGGGIMPDIFVGRDTSLYTPYFTKVSNHAYTYQFAYQYTDKHRKTLEKYSDWKALEAYLNNQNWLNEFVSFCTEKGIEADAAQIAKSKPLIKRIVQAYIVRNILNDEGFFPLYERDDDITKRAVEEICKQ
ncbi:MAG: S41 family peptidase [Paludibacteraceae bacterium]|nr:S41 family peptidase [Paludibacteraceae bacterium]